MIACRPLEESMQKLMQRSRASKTLQLQLQFRCFSQTAVSLSGHNRWSKIKHDKAKADGLVTKQRQAIAQDLLVASRC